MNQCGLPLFYSCWRDLFFHLDGLYRTIFSSLFAGLHNILRNLIHFDTSLIIIHLKDLWARLCTKPTSDTGFLIYCHSHRPILPFVS